MQFKKQSVSDPTNRSTEEVCVGFYLLVATISAAVVLAVQVTSGSAIGGAFLVIAAFWLYVCTVAATALVVLLVNVSRWMEDASTDTMAILFASIILVSLGVALHLGFVANHLQTAMAVGIVGLIFAPLGLSATVFESRLRHRFAKRTS